MHEASFPQASPASPTPYIETQLPDGEPILLRPVQPSDQKRLAQAPQLMSARALEKRFLHPVHHLDEQLLNYLSHPDQKNHVAWGMLPKTSRDHPGYGVARYFILDDPQWAEFSISIIDEVQERGAGTMLLALLCERALRSQVRYFYAEISADNMFFVNRLKQIGATAELDGNVFLIRWDIKGSSEVEVTTSFAQRLASFRKFFRKKVNRY